jgi:glycosyltransferase involved in cell wall biosynthesis
MVLSAEPVGRQMLGSAIRAWELARALIAHADVVVACPDDGAGGAPSPPELPVLRFDRADARLLREPLARTDVVVSQPPWPHVAAELRRSRARLVYDLYDPEPFENLERLKRRPPSLRRAVATLTLDRFTRALRDGRHLMCASETQRALWLGMLLAERLIPPAAYDADPTQRSRIDVVPFGLPEEPPAGEGPGPRELVPGVGPDAEIVLWNGGIWNWLDARSAIRATAALAPRRPRLRLVFMGAAAAEHGAGAEARHLAGSLGVLGRSVFFHDDWVPYEERARWLLQADCAISTHRDHLETHFAFRTRLLDCFWAGLPVVATRGDELANRIEHDDLGAAVPPEDPAAIAAALERVLDRGRGAYAEPLARAAADFGWSKVTAPLVRWITAPAPAAVRPATAVPPGTLARDAAFRAGLGALGLVGLRRWRHL